MKEYLKVEDVMRILQVSRTTAYEIVHSGNLKSFKVGRLVRISAEELQRFIERKPSKKISR